MPPKCARFGSTFSATPCQLTQRVTRTPIAPILALPPDGRVGNPDADPALAPLALDVEAVQRADQPFLQPIDVAAYVLRRHTSVPAHQVEHDIAGALAGAVIGPLPAAPGAERGKAGRVGQFARLGRGAGGVQRRMLDQPHQLAGGAGPDGGDPRLHLRQRGRIFRQAIVDPPLRRRTEVIEPPSFIRYTPAPAYHGAVVAEW